MKRIHFLQTLSVLALGLFISFSSCAQNPPASPAMKANGKVGSANVNINYSSPAVKGRSVWGGLVPYGKVWRAGANEATTFEIDKPVTVEGKALPAGKYALFAIPTESDWTIIFNKEASQWGAFKYDETKDALRVTVKPRKAASFNERLGYAVENNNVVLRWENVEVPVAIK